MIKKIIRFQQNDYLVQNKEIIKYIVQALYNIKVIKC